MIKRTILATTLGFSFCSNALEVQLNVANIEKLQGHVLAVLYDSEKEYSSSGKPLMTKKIPADAGTISTVFEQLPVGQYAIKLFHDENDNGQLDTNLVGLPKEGYGFSNNAGRFGPASYEEAKFSVSADAEITIKLR